MGFRYGWSTFGKRVVDDDEGGMVSFRGYLFFLGVELIVNLVMRNLSNWWFARETRDPSGA